MLLDTLRISFKNLGRKKSRSTLTILGIAIGVASVVLISSMGEIGKYTVGEELDSLGVGALMLSGNQKMVGSALTAEHLEAVRQSGAGGKRHPHSGRLHQKLYAGADAGCGGMGNRLWCQSGHFHGSSLRRLITKNDVAAAKQICVIDKNIALAYYKRENIVGKKYPCSFRPESKSLLWWVWWNRAETLCRA